MYFNFETVLTLATLITGVVWLMDSLFLSKKRLIKQGLLKSNTGCLQRMVMVWGGVHIPGKVKMPRVIEYARSFFPVLFLVLFLRTFFYEPYRIPSGSDKPTLLIGDLILLNKHIYGLHLPVSNQTIYENQLPKRGDMVIFRFSNLDPSKDLIKRVIGLPHDHIRFSHNVLYINGIEAKQTRLGQTTDEGSDGNDWPVDIKREDLLGVSHLIYQRPQEPARDVDVVVPADHYFVMGDNRDDSFDSRFWGFVSRDDLKGKAIYVWLSWNGLSDGLLHTIRWGRIGYKIQ
ncbi:MAG: signal peptidase I [Gammaproteobacteria bacterium]|nr:signal peptidase I [Gammaproteobacteria bacterium]